MRSILVAEVARLWRAWSNLSELLPIRLRRFRPQPGENPMKQFIFLVAATLFFGAAVAEEANAQLFGRAFRRSVTTQRSYTPTYQQSYAYSPSRTRVPQPYTGYGSNLHRNYTIRRAQQKTAITGIPPKNTGNILWRR